MRRVGQQRAEPLGRRGPRGLPGQHPLGVGLGAVLAHQREHGGEVVRPRDAALHAGPDHCGHLDLHLTVSAGSTFGGGVHRDAPEHRVPRGAPVTGRADEVSRGDQAGVNPW